MNSQQSARRHSGPWELRFAENLLRMRERRGMTQTELANELRAEGLPFHQQTIQRIENGERPVRLNEAYRIAAALGAQLEEMTSSFYSTSKDMTWVLDRLIGNGRHVTYAITEHLSDFLGNVSELMEMLDNYRLTSHEEDRGSSFSDLPRWVQTGLAFCYRINIDLAKYEKTIVALGSFLGDDYDETSPEKWRFFESTETHDTNTLLNELDRLVRSNDCEELRRLADKSGPQLLALLRSAAD